jgi:urease accessory protein
MQMTDHTLLRLLQLTDSAFPIGAFAHSYGLETYVAQGRVHNPQTLAEFVANTVSHALAPSDGVACAAVYRAEADWEAVAQDLDRRLTAMKPVTEFRQASRAMGVRLLRTALYLGPLPRAAVYLAAIDGKRLHGHLSLAYGLICRDLGIPLHPALVAWFRNHCASLVTSGVRLIPLGHTHGQTVLVRLGPVILDAAELACGREREDLASFAPGHELTGMIHRDRLTTRLYLS